MANKRFYDPRGVTAAFLANERVHPLPERLLGGHTALLVLDVMQFFFNETSRAFIPASRVVLDRVEALVDSFRKRGSPIVFVRHVDEPGSAMVRWWGEAIDAGEGSALALSPEPTDLVISKSTYDPFYETALDGYLRAQDAQAVAICGVMTHLCCETAARSAFVRGFDVLFVSDATATHNVDFHRATLLNLAHGIAYIVPTAALLGVPTG